jgi:hypothetical protein
MVNSYNNTKNEDKHLENIVVQISETLDAFNKNDGRQNLLMQGKWWLAGSQNRLNGIT